MLKKSLFSLFQFIFFLSLGFFLLWLSISSFTTAQVNQVKNLIFNANLMLVIPCMGALVLSHYIRAIRWKMMFIPLGYTPRTQNVFLAVLAGFFFNLLFPRLGEIMKCTLLSRDEKIPVDRLIGTMVAERIIDVLCLFVVIFLTITTQAELVGAYAQEIWDLLVVKLALSQRGITGILIGLLLLLGLGLWAIRKSSNSRILKKANELIRGVLQGLLSIRQMRSKSIFILYTILIWGLYLVSIRVGFLAMNDLVGLGWIPSLTILTFGSFAMIATQGGIGAYQLIVQKTLVLYGINEVNGLAFGWLLWSVQTIMMFILGPISLILLFLFNRKK